MNILDHIQSVTGIHFKHVSQYKGGAFKGPCPWCGGDDRFTIYPEDDSYICNQCGQAGDFIQFERDYSNKTFREACAAAGVDPGPIHSKSKKLVGRMLKQTAPEPWKPRETKYVSLKWSTKAGEIMFTAYKYLLSANGKSQREYLASRGIDVDTIKAARIGYNPKPQTFEYEAFGLEPVTDQQTGHTKHVWIPQGFLIPAFTGDQVTRIRIRQDNPRGKDRYILLTGSQTAFLICKPEGVRPFSFVTEAELDGWATWAAAGDLVNVFSIGNSTTRPDTTADFILSNTKVLAALDFDRAGAKETEWWENKYNALAWPVPSGKDPGEAVKAGVDIREWVQNGLERLSRAGGSTSTGIVPGVDLGPSPDELAARNKQAGGGVEAAHQEDFPMPGVDHDPVPLDEPPPIDMDRVKCMHNRHCVSLSSGFCLRCKQRVFDMVACPNGRWKIWKDPVCGGALGQVILMPGWNR